MAEGRKGPCAQQIFPETLGIYNYSLFAGKIWHSNEYTWHPLLSCENRSAQRHLTSTHLTTAFAQICFFFFLLPSLPSSLIEE